MYTAHVTEKASIDEAFIDLTPLVLKKLRSSHPQLQVGNVDPDQPLPEAPSIESEQWEGWQAVKTSNESTTKDVPCTWQDWALLYGAEIMFEMRTSVQGRLGFTCSAVSCLGGRMFMANRLGHSAQQSTGKGKFRFVEDYLSAQTRSCVRLGESQLRKQC
jgi:nucleotidyltransferase/DNA polymerase involved in DNA repair